MELRVKNVGVWWCKVKNLLFGWFHPFLKSMSAVIFHICVVRWGGNFIWFYILQELRAVKTVHSTYFVWTVFALCCSRWLPQEKNFLMQILGLKPSIALPCKYPLDDISGLWEIMLFRIYLWRKYLTDAPKRAWSSCGVPCNFHLNVLCFRVITKDDVFIVHAIVWEHVYIVHCSLYVRARVHYWRRRMMKCPQFKQKTWHYCINELPTLKETAILRKFSSLLSISGHFFKFAL